MIRRTFHLICHTHWDREWYLPRAAFQARLIPAVGAVLDLLEREPEARFLLDGQTVIASDTLEIRPEWLDRLRAAVAGRQLAIGPWYILADELVPSGESLIRNLLHGRRSAASLGPPLEVLYSPDAFGHPAILPTLAGEFGIGAGVVWRGLGGGGPDRDLYRWTGPHGAAVLLYHLPPQGYEIGAILAGPRGLDEWPAIGAQLVTRSVTSQVAVFVGADHHAPPTSLVRLRNALARLDPENEFRASSLGEFFSAAAGEVRGLTHLAGSLRASYGHAWTLQGTHATRARLKRRHGAVERYLQRATEPLTALARLRHPGGSENAAALLRNATRVLLECQFHDTICGCCSDDVAREQGVRLTSVLTVCTQIARAALHAMAGHDPDEAREEPQATTAALLLWNPRPVPQRGVTIAELTMFRRDILVGPPGARLARSGPGYQPFALIDASGARYPVQVLALTTGSERTDAARHYPDQDEVDRVWVAFNAPTIPAFGMAVVRPDASTMGTASANLRVAPGRLANASVSVAVNGHGAVTLLDHGTGMAYHDLLSFVDETDDGDSYTPWIAPSSRQASPRLVGQRVMANGPLVGALELVFAIPSATGGVAARLLIALHGDSPLLHLRLTIENGAANHRLRLRVPVGAGHVALAGAAFGWEAAIPIGEKPEPSPSERRTPTAPAQRYLSAGSGARGLALFAPAAFEYEWTAAGELFVTLIRAVGELSHASLPTRPGHAGWPMAIPGAQEPGRHVIDLALAPAPQGVHDDPGKLETLWEEAFLPVQATFIRQSTIAADATAFGGPELDGAGLVCTALKPAESGGGVVLRCFNVRDLAVAGRWRFPWEVASAALARADETPIATLPITGRWEVPFTAPPRGIVTVLIHPVT